MSGPFSTFVCERNAATGLTGASASSALVDESSSVSSAPSTIAALRMTSDGDSGAIASASSPSPSKAMVRGLSSPGSTRSSAMRKSSANCVARL